MNAQYFLGCSGFYYNHWKERFYPQKLVKSKMATIHAQHFNTVEINSTF
jgi:uncharacterized protein YecE (DUF72 family)